ncbi:MAG: hydroxymethylbilane synthase [Legionella sp. 40-6]|nr:MAG: hydroxymethylbilane synthase [Legionella sp. 40-6]
MANNKIRIATRKSPLALWQAEHIRTKLLQLYPELDIQLVPLTTSGDRFLKDKLLAIGGKGLFVKELEEALLDGRADLAVHSAKDVPAEFPKGLGLTAICKRDNPFDALVGNNLSSLEDLPLSATIGTSSLRRQSQLLAIRPDLNIKQLRGNIHTRLQKLIDHEYDAIILAAAGLERMQLDHYISQQLPAHIMLPACGQGALAIESRLSDSTLNDYLAALNEPTSALCVTVERKVNALLGGNCHVPLAIYCAPISDNELLLRARILTATGQRMIQFHQKATRQHAHSLAEQCAQFLLSTGGDALLRTYS